MGVVYLYPVAIKTLKVLHPLFESRLEMKKSKNRCEEIARLLLIENEVRKLENASLAFNIEDIISAKYDCLESNNITMTPIEYIMHAILTRVSDKFCDDYKNDFELYVKEQEQIGKYRVDFVVSASFSDDKIIIECDGHDFHEKTKEQAKHDKERDRFFTSNGYKILRYTGSEIYNDFFDIEKELSLLLDVPSEKSLFTNKGLANE